MKNLSMWITASLALMILASCARVSHDKNAPIKQLEREEPPLPLTQDTRADDDEFTIKVRAEDSTAHVRVVINLEFDVQEVMDKHQGQIAPGSKGYEDFLKLMQKELYTRANAMLNKIELKAQESKKAPVNYGY